MAAAFAPRAPVERKSGTLDYPDAYSTGMIRWRDALKTQAASEWQNCQDLQDVQSYIDRLNGKYWNPNRPKQRSRYSDNVLADQRIESRAGLTDIHPSLNIFSKVKEYGHQAEVAMKIIEYTWQDQTIDLELADVVDYALLNSGFWKMTAYEPGVIELTSHALGTVIPVQMKGRKLQTSSAVIYRDYESSGYFYRRFGERARGIERQAVSLHASLGDDSYTRPDSIPEYQWRTLSPAMKRRMALRGRVAQPDRTGYSTEPLPTIPLEEIYHEDWAINDFGHPVLVKHPDQPVNAHNWHYIVMPGQFLYPRKRLTVFGGDLVVYDGPNPFWDGMYPFLMLSLNPCVWAPGGISKYRDIVPQADSLNRAGAGIEECVMDGVNRNVITRKGAIDPISWDRFSPEMTRQKIMLNGTADVQRDFRYMDAKALPGYVLDWVKFVDQRIKSRSGALDIQGLMSKKQVSGGDAIESMRDAKSSPQRLEGRYVEEFLVDASKMATSRIFQFFTGEQRMRILGQDGQVKEDFDFKPSMMVPANSPKEDHWKLFSVQSKPGSMHANAPRERKVTAITLSKMGKMSLKTLYEVLDMGIDGEQEVKRIKAEASELPQPVKGGGRSPRATNAQKKGSPI